MRDCAVLGKMGQGYPHHRILVLARIAFVVVVGWMRRIADSRICVASIGAGHQHSFLI